MISFLELFFLIVTALGIAVVMRISADLWTSSTEQSGEQGRLPRRRRPLSSECTIKYRTADGEEDYSFRFVQLNSDIRIYIQNQPSYNGRSEDSYDTHRLIDSGGKYICWTGRIATYEDAKSVAKTWAEKTETYRKSGKRF